LVKELERSWREACERRKFRLIHYSIQGDHVHLIVEAGGVRDLACGRRQQPGRIRPRPGAGSTDGAEECDQPGTLQRLLRREAGC
jgi:hypothetical protein